MSRNSLSKKGLAVAVMLLFMGMIIAPSSGFTVVEQFDFLNSVDDGEPIIKIERIPPPNLIPFFRVYIKNIGDANATDIHWSIQWYLGWIFGQRFNDKARITEGEFEVLLPIHSAIIGSIKFGYGKMIVVITAECSEGSSDTAMFEVHLAGPIMIALKPFP